jgi:hypothetical protein
LRKQYFFLILRAQISRQKPSVLAAKRAWTVSSRWFAPPVSRENDPNAL